MWSACLKHYFGVHTSYCPLYHPFIFVRIFLKGKGPRHLSAEVLKRLEQRVSKALALAPWSVLPVTMERDMPAGFYSHKKVNLDSLCGYCQSRTENRADPHVSCVTCWESIFESGCFLLTFFLTKSMSWLGAHRVTILCLANGVSQMKSVSSALWGPSRFQDGVQHWGVHPSLTLGPQPDRPPCLFW